MLYKSAINSLTFFPLNVEMFLFLYLPSFSDGAVIKIGQTVVRCVHGACCSRAEHVCGVPSRLNGGMGCI